MFCTGQRLNMSTFPKSNMSSLQIFSQARITRQVTHGGTVWDPSVVQCVQNDVMF